MAWTLTIYDETGSTVVDTVTHDEASPRIHGGFRAVMRSSGECVSLQFRGRNDLLRIFPRYIVQLNVDGNDLFWGPIVRNPNFSSKGAGPADGDASALEEYIAEGGRTLIRQSMMGFRYQEESWDVGEMMKFFLTLYGHPAVVGDLSAIQNPGAILARYYKPNAQLDMVFDELVSTLPGWVWGVDAVGRVFLKELTGYLQFAASELLDFVYRPADAEDVVTKVNIVVAGAPAGSAPSVNETIYHNDTVTDPSVPGTASYDYVPKPVVFTYEDPLHSFFRAEKSFALPEGLNPFLEPDDAAATPGMFFHSNPANTSSLITGWTDPENVFSRDGSLYAISTDSTPSQITFSIYAADVEQERDLTYDQKIKGFRLVYQGDLSTAVTLWTGSHALFRQTVWESVIPLTFIYSDETATQMNSWYQLGSSPSLATTSDADVYVSMYSVLPASAQMARVNAREGDLHRMNRSTVSVQFRNFYGVIKIHYFYPLVLNEAFLLSVAKANIRIPRTMPGDALVRGYSPPVPVVGIEGVFFQGALVDQAEVDDGMVGDATVDLVDTIEYILTPQDGFVTRYVIGNDDISEAGKVLRQYIDENTARENYALMMTTRQ